MEKEAWVTALEGDSVRVRFFQHASCRNCGGCLSAGNPENEMLIPIPKGTRVKPGDRVKIFMESSVFLRAAFLVYLVPILLFFAGYVVGDMLFGLLGMESCGEAGGVVGGLFFLLLSFLRLRIFDRRLAALLPYQLRVMKSEEKTEEYLNNSL